MRSTVALVLLMGLATAPARADEAAVASARQRIDATIARGPYRATWDSLSAHRDPEWFRDAKFGIYTHWGPITVATDQAPAAMEWYGRELYLKNHPAFAYHRQRFGDQKTVGYKDVIPHFTAAKFDADAWAELFARAGARFAGPVAIHHDFFANWDSAITRWNSKALGPHRDITGELARAIRARGMRFLTTFHHGFAWEYYEPAFAFDAADPRNSDLYGEPHAPKTPPSRRFLDTWLALVDEVLVKYQPDLIWFDFELGQVITPEYQQRMFADTYNRAAEQGHEIGVAHKIQSIHAHTGILDYERGREDRLTPYPWLTDTSVGPWFHHESLGFKTTNELVDVLVDIVSKNGCLLLNVGPRADGTIPAQGRALLIGLGDWLKVNGEAIYDTRPWLIFGEGPTRLGGGAFSEQGDRNGYTAADLRFTRSKNGQSLYVIALDWPGRQLLVPSLGTDSRALKGTIREVHLLGHPAPLTFHRDAQGLHIDLPDTKPCDHAFAVRLRLGD